MLFRGEPDCQVAGRQDKARRGSYLKSPGFSVSSSRWTGSGHSQALKPPKVRLPQQPGRLCDYAFDIHGSRMARDRTAMRLAESIRANPFAGVLEYYGKVQPISYSDEEIREAAGPARLAVPSKGNGTSSLEIESGGLQAPA
jgi:hypothetical protein